MKKKTLLLLSITLFAVGCAAVPGNAQQPAASSGRSATPSTTGCKGPIMAFRISYNKLEVKPSPENTCIYRTPGKANEAVLPVRVRLLGNNAPSVGEVSATLKAGQSGYTVSGSIDDPKDKDEFNVTITKTSGDFAGGDEVSIDLNAAGAGSIDPRVTIVDSGLLGHQKSIIQEYVLDELGIMLLFDEDSDDPTMTIEDPSQR